MSRNWDGLYRRRKEVRARYRRLWSLPVVRRVTDLAEGVVRDCPHAPRVLDVGANDRRLADRLRAVRQDVTYESADPDPTHSHEYADVSEAPLESYDLVTFFEVIEHLPLADGIGVLRSIRERLRPGGVLVLTTPNVFVPGQFHRDATHITAFAYDELGGALLEAGFGLEELELVRLYNDGLLGKLLHRVLLYPLHRSLGVDYAESVAAVAAVPGAGGGA